MQDSYVCDIRSSAAVPGVRKSYFCDTRSSAVGSNKREEFGDL